MTKDQDFKQIVRDRMARTGETYLVARTAIEHRPAGADPAAYAVAQLDQQRLVARLFDEGRLIRIPAKRRVRVAALLEVLSRFEPGRDYLETEVNAVLRAVHDDVASLRRELVTYRYLERTAGV